MSDELSVAINELQGLYQYELRERIDSYCHELFYGARFILCNGTHLNNYVYQCCAQYVGVNEGSEKYYHLKRNDTYDLYLEALAHDVKNKLVETIKSFKIKPDLSFLDDESIDKESRDKKLYYLLFEYLIKNFIATHPISVS